MSSFSLINCLKVSCLSIFLLILQSATAQPRKAAKDYGTERFADADAMITAKQKMLGTDLAVLVWKDTLVYRRELGAYNGKTAGPVGAASQWLTAALVLQLVDEGKLSLDDPITSYLPIFEKYGKNYITLRHCLTHMTGIQAGKPGLLRKKYSSIEEEAEAYAKHEIQTNPGTEVRYSDIGPVLAARVVEVATKKKFDQLIRSKLFTPLGMRQTSFSTFNGSAPDPATGAQSSANDLISFLRMILNKGQFNGKQVLSEASVKELTRIAAPPGGVKAVPRGAEGLGYALGSWVVEEKGGQAAVLAAPGFSGAWPLVDLCRGYALVIFTKEAGEAQKADVYLEIKRELDEQLGACR